jgi:carbon-monoxide dehydrogenase large subunit
MAGMESIACAASAVANAVVDALAHLGVTNIDIPITAPSVWAVLKE